LDILESTLNKHSKEQTHARVLKQKDKDNDPIWMLQEQTANLKKNVKNLKAGFSEKEEVQ
jgi:hypothetical protein